MTDFARLLTALSDGKVDFILIGGLAATVHGAARLTQDVDVVYSRNAGNLDRLAAALVALEPYPRGAPPGLPFDWSSATLRVGFNFTLTTAAGDLDLLGEIAGGGSYDSLVAETVSISLFGQSIRCLTLPALIRAKRAAGRPKDFESIAELELLRDGGD
ncbi:MAG: hypothetical protein ACT4OZ_11725 [Gemmatimonadota bacterium]